jgi:hypothetical protein
MLWLRWMDTALRIFNIYCNIYAIPLLWYGRISAPNMTAEYGPFMCRKLTVNSRLTERVLLEMHLSILNSQHFFAVPLAIITSPRWTHVKWFFRTSFYSLSEMDESQCHTAPPRPIDGAERGGDSAPPLDNPVFFLT